MRILTGRGARNVVTDHVSAFQDVMPTLLEVAGGKPSEECDGITFLPTLLGEGAQREHEYLHWEFFGYQGQQAVRMGKWKAMRVRLKQGNTKIRLFDLSTDLGESKNVAVDHPELVKRFDEIMRTDRTPNPNFKIEMLDE